MKTLDDEQITALEVKHARLVATARAGATLASLCRGAIRGCTERTDPDGKVKAMLEKFLDLAGFDFDKAETLSEEQGTP